MTNLKILFITTAILSFAIYKAAQAEISSESYYGDRTFTKYTNDDGSYFKLSSYINGSFYTNYKYYHYFLGREIDENGNDLGLKIDVDYNARIYDDQGNVVGVVNRWGTSMSSNHATLNYKENGQLISKQDRNGNIIETYKYDSNGKLLIYDNEGKLKGAFDNFFNALASTDNFYKENLSLLDENGNYQEKDSNGKVINLYSKNGDITKYKYDGGGNVVSAYKNGKLIYAKKIYTPAEAAAATHDGNDNVVSITW